MNVIAQAEPIVQQAGYARQQAGYASSSRMRCSQYRGCHTPRSRCRSRLSVTGNSVPPLDGNHCACHELGGDGIDDLLLKFSTPDLAKELELASLPPGTPLVLTVGGFLTDGTRFEASDCIIIPGRGAMQKKRGRR